jgi:hypothetical protein
MTNGLPLTLSSLKKLASLRLESGALELLRLTAVATQMVAVLSLNRPPFRRPDLLKETGSAERSNKPLSSRSPTLAKPTARSRLTNGKELLPGVDGRSLWARRFRDVLALHLSDLGGEGQSVRSGEGNRAASGLSHCRARADRS